MPSMKAVRIHSYGGVDVLMYEDAPRPTPGQGEILVRVRGSSVNPFDCALRAGYLASYFNHPLPLILGTDFSGTVEELGPGANHFMPGDQVYGRGGVTRNGTYAEYAVLAASDIAPKPRSLDDAHAAVLPHVTLTAWQGLIAMADLKKGQTVLIHGAAGGVGHVAVQLAKWRGARVVGTASQNIGFLDELPVDQAIDYSSTPFEEVVKDVDVVLDTIGGDTQDRSWGVLKPGGMLLSTVQQPSQETAARYGVRQGMIASMPPSGEILTEVAKLVDAGTIMPHLSSTLPLGEIHRAHSMIEGKHTRGKIGLQVS